MKHQCEMCKYAMRAEAVNLAGVCHNCTFTAYTVDGGELVYCSKHNANSSLDEDGVINCTGFVEKGKKMTEYYKREDVWNAIFTQHDEVGEWTYTAYGEVKGGFRALDELEELIKKLPTEEMKEGG